MDTKSTLLHTFTLMQIHFSKYHGTGNDFVLLDNRKNEYSNLTHIQIAKICARHFGIGADGLMLLNNSTEANFGMTYYNSDGNQSSMCGNGGRCITAFAKHLGIIEDAATFMAIDGLHHSTISGNYIELHMQNTVGIAEVENGFILNTGSPHLVQFVDNAKAVDVRNAGAAIRYNEVYNKEGINVNFTEVRADKTLFVCTYERGVEDETLSCGTGVTAAALVQIKDKIGHNYVRVQTKGGTLMVKCINQDRNNFTDIWLCADAHFVFTGTINV